MSNFKKIALVILGLLILAGLILGLSFLIPKWQMIKKAKEVKLTPEQKSLQEISEEIEKSKFDLIGTIISVAPDGKSLVVKTEAGSQTVEKYKGKETKLSISEQVQVFDKEGKSTQLSNLKPQTSANIKGTIEKDQLIAELITLQ